MLTKKEFLKRTKIQGRCRVWARAILKSGYGEVYFRGKVSYAHRVAWELFKGPIPVKLNVCHACDNRACVKTTPDKKFPKGHLFLGTQKDNLRDAATKGRMPGARLPGERNPNAKLKDEQVREMRRLHAEGWGFGELAKKYRITFGCCWRIVVRQTWKHVE